MRKASPKQENRLMHKQGLRRKVVDTLCLIYLLKSVERVKLGSREVSSQGSILRTSVRVEVDRHAYGTDNNSKTLGLKGNGTLSLEPR